MKNLRKMVMLILTLAMLTTGVQVSVLADQTTDLQSMKVYAVNAAGKKTKAELNFSSTTYTYDITVMSDTESIEIVASPATSGSTWAIEKDGINTKMDFGKNYTAVVVTSSTGAKTNMKLILQSLQRLNRQHTKPEVQQMKQLLKTAVQQAVRNQRRLLSQTL